MTSRGAEAVTVYVIISLFFLQIRAFTTEPPVPLRLLNLIAQPPVPYALAWDLQKELMEHHIARQEHADSGVCGTVVLLEHRSVYTLGTATKEDSGPFTTELKDGSKLTYDLFQVERAGEATYHGPGQLVVYPILDLNYFEKDIDKYLRGLETVVIKSLEHVGIPSAGRIEGLTGVWVGDQKLAAIGIKLRRWVTMHGVSVNVCPDMRYFANIIPCGIRDKSVGSVAGLSLPPTATVDQFARIFLDQFCEHFNVRWSQVLEGDNASQFLDTVTRQHTEQS